LIALTAPVAPACRVTPTASRKIAGISRYLEPSIRIATLLRAYGGVLTTVPSVPVTALAASLSRLETFGFVTPMSLAGTLT